MKSVDKYYAPYLNSTHPKHLYCFLSIFSQPKFLNQVLIQIKKEEPHTYLKKKVIKKGINLCSNLHILNIPLRVNTQHSDLIFHND